MSEYVTYNIMNFSLQEQAMVNNIYKKLSQEKNGSIDLQSIHAAKDLLTNTVFLVDKNNNRYYDEVMKNVPVADI